MTKQYIIERIESLIKINQDAYDNDHYSGIKDYLEGKIDGLKHTLQMVIHS